MLQRSGTSKARLYKREFSRILVCRELKALKEGNLQNGGKRGALNYQDDFAAADVCVSKATFLKDDRQDLSRALCRGNAGMYDCSIITVARDIGRASILRLKGSK